MSDAPKTAEGSGVPVPVKDDETSHRLVPDGGAGTHNPGELQVEILLESHRVIMRRLTAVEAAVDALAESLTTQDERVRKQMRVLQAEIDGIKQALYKDAAPRRCEKCSAVLSALATVCPSCGK